MRSPRKFALVAGVMAASLLVALLVLPLLFQDRITARLKTEINDAVAARVDWSGVGLSLLRDFPNATLTMDRLSVVGVKPFDGDTLVSMRHARLVLAAGSVIRHLANGDRIIVREVVLEQPDVRLRVLVDGTANWDIARAQQPASRDGSRAVRVALRDFRISDGRITLDDQQSRLEASVAGLDESLRGDFSEERFMLATRTRADSVSVRFAGLPYLNRVGLELNADVDADLPAHRFAVKDGSLRLNKLLLAFAGSVTAGSPNLGLDLKFSTPGTAFADILSLVPAIYAKDFEEIRTSGTMSVAAQVRGAYGPNAFPALAVRAKVENGAFRYPSLPLPARDIALELAIDNPGGHVDNTVVNLKRFHAVIGRRPLDARMVVRTPVSDPDVDARVVGALDLADVARTVRLEGVRELSGRVAANVAMRARLSDIDAGRYERVDARGTVHAARVAVRSAALPHPVAIDTAALRLTPRTAELTGFAAKVGSSDVRAAGSLDNLLGFLLRDEDLRGRATVSSNHLDLNEWRSDDALTVIPVPPRVDFALNASADRVLYGALSVANVRGGVRIKDQRATLEDLRMEMLRGSVIASGYYETTVPGRPGFDIDLRLATVDIPTAFASLTTVQTLAPVARWARGTVSGTVGLRGTLGEDMLPLFAALTGKGSIETDRLALQDAPVLGKLADALSLESLRNPALGAVRASFDVVDGRLHVKPFDVAMNGIAMTVGGSHGIDQSLKYDLGLAVPRASFGNAFTKLASQARRAGAELNGGEVVNIGALVTGTVADPAVRPDFAGAGTSVRNVAQQVVQAGVESRTAAVREKADSAAEEARRRARAEGDRLVAEAEEQAAKIRAEASALAAKVRQEANVRADSLQARATNPAARIAAQVTTDRMRREADQQAERIEREANERADALVAQAKLRADALVSY